jgi:hypothetical protein
MYRKHAQSMETGLIGNYGQNAVVHVEEALNRVQ